jgi:hypothetical protein
MIIIFKVGIGIIALMVILFIHDLHYLNKRSM